jgi:hypothetical protein
MHKDVWENCELHFRQCWRCWECSLFIYLTTSKTIITAITTLMLLNLSDALHGKGKVPHHEDIQETGDTVPPF